MSNTHLTYTPRPDATPESELDALVTVYKFILQRHESRKAADPTGDQNEVKEVRAVDPDQKLPQ